MPTSDWGPRIESVTDEMRNLKSSVEKLIDAIQGSQTGLNTRTAILEQGMKGIMDRLDQMMRAVESNMASTNRRVDGIADDMDSVTKDVTKMQVDHSRIEVKIDDIDGRVKKLEISSEFLANLGWRTVATMCGIFLGLGTLVGGILVAIFKR